MNTLYKLLLLINISHTFSFINNVKIKKVEKTTTYIPDIKKRELMNSILLNNIYISCGTLASGYLSFFYPKVNNNVGDGIIAKNKFGEEVYNDIWTTSHKYPSRDLVEGINGDPYYLITLPDNNIEKYALNAICTHLGCVVPWNNAEQKFMCPCHGSQYNNEGKVIRGPAPRSLKLGKVDIINNKVSIKEWKENDFRDNSEPWWI